ncbi:hypothetical protein MRX96_043063 [Rhipicephalus microplus]
MAASDVGLVTATSRSASLATAAHLVTREFGTNGVFLGWRRRSCVSVLFESSTKDSDKNLLGTPQVP